MENKGSVLMQRYEMGRLLGQGTFAKVHHARNLKTGMSVAIKIIDKERILKVGMIDQIKREISVMRLIRHPNVVELYEVMASKTKIYFVMEYVKGGELFNKVSKGKLKEDVARKYFQQLISAVDYCHSRGVSDFGLSALGESKRQDGLLHTTCGTPAYVAPEVINRKGYDGTKADIWSCGVILYVLLAGYLPFHDSNLMEMYRKIGKGDFKFPNWFSPEVRKLLSKILDPNPKTRISMAKIMQNSWFRKGLVQKPVIAEVTVKEPAPLDVDAIFGPSEGSNSAVESKQELAKPSNLNAFDIISYSAGFDLSGLFEQTEQKKEVRFTSNKTAPTIISKLEDIAKRLRLKIKKRDGGLLKMEGSTEGRKGVLGIETEIFEITPFFHLVEVKKCSGDTLEYQKVMKKDIRPALKDIVWTWQGEQLQQEQPQLGQQEQEPRQEGQPQQEEQQEPPQLGQQEQQPSLALPVQVVSPQDS
ncbi:CBL-interacting protein kinase 2 isoform X2 [Prunus yedoensis var. nudiflora]|uniref:non-specific serine/threonine protein kinase n=1 Tax=Prunus yedoensis var. nudiflora TaxID=2094558 RepID=A0A314Y727_PRUYE|nr:CBL-interacting protein kinase 2 isoform X2 [Prunus yedoensis var. nudiflora]